MKQGCPASPLLFSLYLDELETFAEDASEHIDCPRLAQLLIAILTVADDIALFSYSPRELQHQLNILQEFCTARGLKVNVLKTKTMVFESRRTHTPPFTYAGAAIDQVEGVQVSGHHHACHQGPHSSPGDPLQSCQTRYVWPAQPMPAAAHS